eukprot:357565-Chlamydomonas_euryale.AAC.9
MDGTDGWMDGCMDGCVHTRLELCSHKLGVACEKDNGTAAVAAAAAVRLARKWSLAHRAEQWLAERARGLTGLAGGDHKTLLKRCRGKAADAEHAEQQQRRTHRQAVWEHAH